MLNVICKGFQNNLGPPDFQDVRQPMDYGGDQTLGFMDGDRSYRYSNDYSYTGPMESANEDYSEFFRSSGGNYAYNTEDYSTALGDLGTININVINGSGGYQPSPSVLLHIDDMMKGISRHMSFTDVSLVAESQKISVHKSILASHSTFLRQILITNDFDVGESEDPLLILPNVNYAHVQMMVQFFYSGEVVISSRIDIQPLREICVALGVSSLIGRLDEINQPFQAGPTNYDNIVVMVQPPPDLGALDDADQLPNLSNSEIERAANNFDTTYLNSYPPPQPPPPHPQMPPPSVTTTSACSQPSEITPVPQPAPNTIPSIEVQGRVKKKAFSCNRCTSKFYTQECLLAHERLHEEKKPFSCNTCGKSISTRAHLAVHMRIHSGEKPFVCEICQKPFKDQGSLKRHKNTHEEKKNNEEKKSHECGVCQKVFVDRSTYKRHYKEKHQEDSKKFMCNICVKLFNRRETLSVHSQRVHNVPLPNDAQTKEKEQEIEAQKWKTKKCPICGMMFSKQSSMEIHIRRHTGYKPYVCEICGKNFARSNNLKLHKRTHTGEKPYECSECHKRFSDVSTLRRHIRMHTGEKPYECSKCHRGFAQVGAKNCHEKTCTEQGAANTPIIQEKNNVIPQQQQQGQVPGVLYVNQTPNSFNTIMGDNSLAIMDQNSGLNSLDPVRASCI